MCIHWNFKLTYHNKTVIECKDIWSVSSIRALLGGVCIGTRFLEWYGLVEVHPLCELLKDFRSYFSSYLWVKLKNYDFKSRHNFSSW